ncbi:recombination protein Rad52 [Venturia nashicola]|nr:recombination protein Rad52 [Venturia nashicola]
MPAQSDQRAQAAAIPNPFIDTPPRISEYSAQEIAQLQSRLDKQLGPEYISSRQGPGGGKVHYLAAEKVINLANEVFGFNGWSSEIKDVTIDYVDVEKDGRITMGCSIIVRITLRDGTHHEDIGYGEIKNANGKGAAFEKAKKEAATDAVKRALRTFGNVLGNCLYDKSYLQKITKVKVEPSRWDVDKLHRHHDYAPMPKEPAKPAQSEAVARATSQPGRTMSEHSRASLGTTDMEDEYGGNLFDEVDFSHPDEVFLDATETEITDAKMTEPIPEIPKAPERQALSRAPSIPALRTPNTGQSTGSNQAQMRQQQQRMGPMISGQANYRSIPPINGRMQVPHPNSENQQPQKPAEVPLPPSRATTSTPETPQQSNQQRPQPNVFNAPHNNGGPPAHEPPVGFITARAADKVQDGLPTVITPALQAFNPHAESPSIRKTTGIDHRRSAPINRQVITAGAPNVAAQSGAGNPGMMPNRPTNFVNPQADVSRRIGMPMGGQGPLANRGAYKPPGPAGIKRGLPEGTGTAGGRPPLADMSNMQRNQAQQDSGDGLDAKRQKVDGGL